jgi:hypothetical protein
VSASPSTAKPDIGLTDQRADRITAAGAQDMLERLQNAALLDSGVVNVIGLDAIRRKLGDRWPAKRAQIWEHVERELDRGLSPADIYFRTDEISYMIAQPGAAGFAAQSVCMSILQEVLKFFLGESRFADIDVRTVTAIEGNQVTSAAVDLIKLRRGVATAPSSAGPASIETPAEQLAHAVTGPLADQAPAPAPWKPPLAGRSSIIELEPPKREPFDLKLTVDGVWNLRRGLITSFLIERGGVGLHTDAADLAEIDVATFAYAAVILEEQARQGGPLTLHVPISFTSLATQRTRDRLLSLTQSVREAMRKAVLLEICGLDAGVPPSRLIEVVGLMRSLCVGVVGRVQPTKAALAAAKGCGLRAVAVEADLLAPHKPEYDARLKAFVTLARPVSPNLLIHGLRDLKQIDLAAATGFSHASVAMGAEG